MLFMSNEESDNHIFFLLPTHSFIATFKTWLGLSMQSWKEFLFFNLLLYVIILYVFVNPFILAIFSVIHQNTTIKHCFPTSYSIEYPL